MGRQRQQQRLVGLGGGSSQRRIGAPTCKFYNLSSTLPPCCCFFVASYDVGMLSTFASAASDVDPGNVVGQRMAQPAVVVENAAEQTTLEQTEEQPAVVTAVETTEEDPAQARTGASTPTRDDEATRTPPPSSVTEDGDRAPTPSPAEERRAPTLPREEASSPKGSPSRGKGLLIPITTAGVARRVRRPRRPLTMRWRRSRGARRMVANTFSCGVNVGTTSLVTKSSPRPRRRPE